MKTDRELLELAAKAAKYEINFDEPIGEVWYPYGYDEYGDVIEWWNPLVNDGDSLRLAVALNLNVSCGVACRSDVGWFTELEANSKLDATRRAIVRAAAAIGEAMP